MPSDNSDEALPPNYQHFPDGSLLRVVFHNFLTYEHTSFIPTASLNMILGHNGSGKSSIICGICLACGGNPKSLGRSEKIIEYIRHGCTEGYVEIAIADKDKGPQTVRLTIRVGKPPEYRLNNAIASQTDINALRKFYNIQIDNPCAFLAQDKVKSFSEQSSIELLKNTEKAASDDLDQRHRELMEQRKDSTTIEDKCTSSEKAVKHLEDEIMKITPLVENYRKKMALQSKLRLLEKKMRILEFQKADEEYNIELKKMDEAMVEYRDVEKKVSECQANKKKYEERLKTQSSEVIKLQRAANESLATVQQNTDRKLVEKMLERAKIKLESAKSVADQHEKEIEKCRKKMEQARVKMQETTEDLAGFDEFLAEQKIAEKKFADAERKNRLEEDTIQKKVYDVRRLENKHRDEDQDSQLNKNERYRALQGFNGDAARAWRWYQANRKEFKGDVHHPIMDVVLTTPEASKVLENSVGMRDRFMFVCEYKEDELLINGKQNTWRINTTVVTADKIYQEDISAKLTPELARQGFKCLASNCFDAPPALKQYLCNVSGLNKIPIGGPEVEKKIEEVSKILEQMRILVFLTNSLRCQITKSKYSTESLKSQTAIRDPLTWRDQCFRKSPIAKKGNDGNLEEIKKLRSEIDLETVKLREKRRVIQKERDNLRQEQVEWKAKKQVHIRWKSELVTETSRFERLENETIDIQSAEREYNKVNKRTVEETKKMLAAASKGQEEYIKNLYNLGRCAVSETNSKWKINKLNVEVETHLEKLSDLKHVKDAAEDQLKTALNKRKAARNNLILECELQHLNEGKMSSTEKNLYEKLIKMFNEAKVPTDMEDLALAISTERARLQVAEDSGEDGSIEHEHQLERLNMDLTTENSKHDKLIQNRELLHGKLGTDIDTWREEVEAMIERINENYVKFFETLGCRGEVSLETPENPLDIEKYGIMIMVCFRRGENMKRLDNKVQSGGERSVATMLYLLALQQLCPVPFRCIDEINQGMDPTNERKVFDIMVGLWNGTSGSLTKTQYFLLSPKLLHGLDMRDNVNIVMVNSTLTNSHGKHYDTSSKIDATFARLGINA